MIFQSLLVGPLGVNCYIVGDEHTRHAIVIDPGGNARDILNALERIRLSVTTIVNTHAHFDHLLALNEVRNATRAPFLIHEAEAPILSAAQASAATFGLHIDQPKNADRLVHDGDVIQDGEIQLTVLHTPGHTPGGICLRMEDRVLVGDTLFQGSIGRTDFPGGDYAALLQSIRDKLLPLPDKTIVYPGHGAATTIGEEKQLNPFVRPLITGKWMV